jgi:hypothetical protein
MWPRLVPIRNGKHAYTHATVGMIRIDIDEGTTRGWPRCDWTLLTAVGASLQ